MIEEKNSHTNVVEGEDIAQALQNIRDTIAAGNTVAMGDVLELTEVIDVAQAQSAPSFAPEPESTLPEMPKEEAIMPKQPESGAISRQALKSKAKQLRRQEEETMLSPEVMAKSQDMLEQFLHQAMPPKASKRHSGDAVTLEDFAAAILKKEIAAWINKNLPDMVRSVIEKEIKHLISKSRD